MQVGRCNVRRFFPLAATVLEKNNALFSDFIVKRIRFDEAVEVSFGLDSADHQFYELFDQGKIGKTCLRSRKSSPRSVFSPRRLLLTSPGVSRHPTTRGGHDDA